MIQLVDQPGDARALDQVKPQLRGIVAGLLMLDKTKALQVVERIGAVIATRLAPSGATFKPEHLERLADSIVSVEYYMETVQRGPQRSVVHARERGALPRPAREAACD